LNVLDFIGNHKKANLAPYLLSGRKPGHGVLGGGMQRLGEEFPADCFVDFDFRLVDLFEKMARDSMKLDDIIREEFERIRSELGEVPSRLEFFTYLDSDLFFTMKKQPKKNIFRDYAAFLKRLGINSELDGTLAAEFLKRIEVTGMVKSYKMPVLLAFYNDGHPKARVSNSDLFRNFKNFYEKGSNKVDLLKDKNTADFEDWTEADYAKKSVKKQPLDALSNSESEFFYREGEEFCLAKGLLPYLNHLEFVKQFKDVIDFRTRQFYLDRFEKN
jgi:hypothetical protein